MKFNAAILLGLLMLLTSGCAEQTEDQQVAKFRSSLTYKAYQFTSEKSAHILVDKYNNSKVTDKNVHGMLGLFWLAKNKPQLACVEADSFSELTKGKSDNLSLAIRTISFDKMKLSKHSAEEYEKLKANISKDEGKNTPEQKMALMGQVLVGLHKKDDKIATSSAGKLESIGKLDYMKPLVSLAIDVRDGRISEATHKLDELRNRPNLSPRKLAMLNEFQSILAAQKPNGEMSEEAIARMMDSMASGVLSDVFNSSRLTSILNKLR